MQKSAVGQQSLGILKISTPLIRVILAGVCIVLLASAARASTFVVTTTADGNNGACTVSLCTLRDAVIAANANAGADIITLPAGTYALTLHGANEQAAATGDLDVTGDLTINGVGSATTTIDGDAADRVFEVIGAVTLTLNGVTMRNGSTAASTIKNGGGIFAGSGTVVLNNSVLTGNNGITGQGGGIFTANATLTNSTVSQNQTSNQGGGIFATSLTMTNSSVTGNQSTGDQGGGLFLINGSSTLTASTISGNTSADDGGGIFLNGSINVNAPALLTITNSTISNNTNSGGSGGGMFILSFATVTITSSTISGNNSISNPGGGISNVGASVTLGNTIVAINTNSNCVGTITNGGTNMQFPGTTCGAGITSADPLLQPLASNGGPTQTESLSSGSPAIDAGSGCPPPATDQRGVSRPQGSACEIGSFECQTGECGSAGTPTPTPTLAPTATATPVGVPTATPTPVAGVVVPTLSSPMLGLLGLALAFVAVLFLKRL